jgi:hypothetical protein
MPSAASKIQSGESPGEADAVRGAAASWKEESAELGDFELVSTDTPVVRGAELLDGERR